MWIDGSWGWWGPGVLFLIVCMFMMVRMMSHGHRRGSHGSHRGQPAGHRAGEAERILAERLAQGEIDIEDYERRLAALKGTGDLGRT